jgi:hypothetical protein
MTPFAGILSIERGAYSEAGANRPPLDESLTSAQSSGHCELKDKSGCLESLKVDRGKGLLDRGPDVHPSEKLDS